MRRLAHCFTKGVGCKKDAKRALQLLEDLSQTCTKPHTLYQLGMMYHTGVLPEGQAMHEFQRVVDDDPGHTDAWLEMGMLHWTGKGVPRQ